MFQCRVDELMTMPSDHVSIQTINLHYVVVEEKQYTIASLFMFTRSARREI